MKEIRRRRPSPALIVACIALIAAMSGAAVALPGKNSVKSDDIAKGAVKGKHVKSDSIKGKHVKEEKLKSAHIKDGSLSAAELGDYNLLGDSPVKSGATSGANLAAARAAAPEIPLWSEGSIDVYAKCLYDTGAATIQGEMYVRTSADGAMMEGEDDIPGAASGTEFLNVATPEAGRQLDIQTNSVANSAGYNEAEGLITSAEGHGYHALTNIGVKQGNPAGGNGPFGAGNACLFGGAVFG